jgi:hypothetical protein
LKPKIFALSQFGYVGKYRVDNPMRAIGEMELADVTIASQEVMLEDLERFDIVIANRQHSHQWEGAIAVIKRRARVLFVHDWDDQEFMVPRTNPARPQFFDRGNKTYRTIRAAKNMNACDLITTSTPILAEDALWYNENVVCFPNNIDPRDWTKIVPMVHPDEQWMGFLGSDTHHDSMSLVIEPISKALLEFADLYFIVCGYPQLYDMFPREVWHKIRSMPFDRGPGDGKSDNPVLEVGAIGFSRKGVGIPIIVTPATYGDTADAAGQIVAHTHDEWHKAIKMLYYASEAKVHFGKKVFQYVCDHRLEKQHARARFDVYMKAYEERTSWPTR